LRRGLRCAGCLMQQHGCRRFGRWTAGHRKMPKSVAATCFRFH